MVCPGCGAFVPEDAGFCRGCGKIVRGPKIRLGPPPGAVPAPPPLSPPAAWPPAASWPYAAPAGRPGGRVLTIQPTGNDLLVAIFTGVALVSLFLPFYRVRASDIFGDTVTPLQFSALNGYAGGWRWLAVASSVLILLYLFVRLIARGQSLPVPIPHTPLLAGLVTINLALVLLAFFSLPFGGFSESVDGAVAGVAQAWGAFVALSAAVLALAASLFNRSPRVR